MTENKTEAAAQPQAAPLIINGQYIKDFSFEAPTAPGIFGMMQKTQPEMSVNVDVGAKPLQGNTFEVMLQIRAECTVGETKAFIMELSYGGVFTLNVPDEHKEPLLLIECPRLLFPFARSILGNTSREAGFPPVMLGPPDFVSMYQQGLKERNAKAEAEAKAKGEKPN